MGSGDIENKPRTSKTQEILAEAQRRLQERTQQEMPPGPRTLAEKLTRFVYWLAQHWLAVFNTLAGIYIGGAISAPLLMHAGLAAPARMLYAFYSTMCHQYPFRSWFLFGQRFAYPLTKPIRVQQMNELRSFIGDPTTGYKIALCQRDVAIYGVIFLAGVAYALIRKKRQLQPWPIWSYFVFGIAPMMLDGGIQWMSYLLWVLPLHLVEHPFETIPLMRTITGALFGYGVVATAYPYMNEYFDDVNKTIQRKLNKISNRPEVIQ